MRGLHLLVRTLVLSCVLTGCSEPVPAGVATPENPQAGIDAAKALSGSLMDLEKTRKQAEKTNKK
jgi:hypothetical protein